MAERRGWIYRGTPESGGDARKLVTLEEDTMRWVGIRAFHASEGRWYNGNEPERATVIAWRDLDQPARGHWVRGRLQLATDRSDECPTRAFDDTAVVGERPAIRRRRSEKA